MRQSRRDLCASRRLDTAYQATDGIVEGRELVGIESRAAHDNAVDQAQQHVGAFLLASAPDRGLNFVGKRAPSFLRRPSVRTRPQ